MRLITTTYSCVTPESAEHGDFSSTGWIDEDGYSCDPEPCTCAEDCDCESAADLAFEFLDRESAEPSSSSWYPGVWYSQAVGSTNYHTGEVETRSYHLQGFTDEESREIFSRIYRSYQ